jgi:hypothetical protein
MYTYVSEIMNLKYSRIAKIFIYFWGKEASYYKINFLQAFFRNNLPCMQKIYVNTFCFCKIMTCSREICPVLAAALV